MNFTLFIVVLMAIQPNAMAQILNFPQLNKTRHTEPMNLELMSFIATTLHIGKPALNLACWVKVREIKQERKFSDGVRIVEMLQITYGGGIMSYPEQTMFFPVGSQVIRSRTVSRFSGTVEEIELISDDLEGSHFTFQHDGQGEIVWMIEEDDLKTVPCRLR